MTYQSDASNFPFIQHTEDPGLDFASAGGGGRCIIATAGGTLLIGDLVFFNPGGRVVKSLESSAYFTRFAGVVVGGAITNYAASNDATLIGLTASTVGQLVVVQISGVANCMADATTVLRYGDPISAGRTTAGRVRPDLAYSVCTTIPGLAIKSGASALAKVVNATAIRAAGLAGTAIGAATDCAALSGTVTNALFNIYVFRTASDGSTMTSAMGTEGASLPLVVWPTGSTTLITIGYVIINPTGTGNFVGGTTALDDATVVPNARYVDMSQTRTSIGIYVGGTIVTPAAGAAIKVLLN